MSGHSLPAVTIISHETVLQAGFPEYPLKSAGERAHKRVRNIIIYSSNMSRTISLDTNTVHT